VEVYPEEDKESNRLQPSSSSDILTFFSHSFDHSSTQENGVDSFRCKTILSNLPTQTALQFKMNLFYGSDGQVTGKESNWTPKITTKRFFVDFLIYRNINTLFFIYCFFFFYVLISLSRPGRVDGLLSIQPIIQDTNRLYLFFDLPTDDGGLTIEGFLFLDHFFKCCCYIYILLFFHRYDLEVSHPMKNLREEWQSMGIQKLVIHSSFLIPIHDIF